MKFCEKCGKEILDDAVVCIGCGCPVNAEVQPVAEKTIKPKKPLWLKIVISVVAVILVAAIAVGVFFVVNMIRANQVKDLLEGKTFRFYERTNYVYGANYYTEKICKFDYNANLEYTYYYSNINSGNTYYREYEVYFEDGMAFLRIGANQIYEVQYDRYGNINALYDTELDELYERK